jgi:hypothetical protein
MSLQAGCYVNLAEAQPDHTEKGNRSALRDPERRELQDVQLAITAVPEDHLRSLVTEWAQRHSEIRYALLQELKHVTCTQCGEDFDARAIQAKDECAYHPGTLFLSFLPVLFI